MTTDGPIERVLREIEETADEKLESRFGLDADRADELDDLLREYRRELRTVHDEFRERLADAGFDNVIADDEGATALDADATDSGVDEEGRDGSSGP